MALVMVVGIYFFKFPNHFAFGGVSGLSTVISQMTGLSASAFTNIANYALLVVGFVFLGKSVGVRTVYATVVMSVGLELLEKLVPLSAPLTSEPLLELIALMPPDTPKFLIPGDTDGPLVESKAHSSLSVYTDWAERLAAAGIQILDKPVLITREKGRIWFVPEELYAMDLEGMRNVFRKQIRELNDRATTLTADDAARIRALEYEVGRIDELEQIRKEILPTDIQVALTHTPLTREYVADLVSWGGKEDTFSMRYASLILAGHYNGGQWRLPFVGAVHVPELGWFPEDSLVQGLSYLEGIPQYVSPGLGSDPHYEYQPGRVFNPPVMTRIVLTRGAK